MYLIGQLGGILQISWLTSGKTWYDPEGLIMPMQLNILFFQSSCLMKCKIIVYLSNQVVNHHAKQ